MRLLGLELSQVGSVATGVADEVRGGSPTAIRLSLSASACLGRTSNDTLVAHDEETPGDEGERRWTRGAPAPATTYVVGSRILAAVEKVADGGSRA